MNDFATFYREIAALEREAKRGKTKQDRAQRREPLPRQFDEQPNAGGYAGFAPPDADPGSFDTGDPWQSTLERLGARPSSGAGGPVPRIGLRDPLQERLDLAESRADQAAADYSPLNENWGWLDQAAGFGRAALDAGGDLLAMGSRFPNVRRQGEADWRERGEFLERAATQIGPTAGAIGDWLSDNALSDAPAANLINGNERAMADADRRNRRARTMYEGQARRTNEAEIAAGQTPTQHFYDELDVTVPGPSARQRIGAAVEDFWIQPARDARQARHDYVRADELEELAADLSEGDAQAFYEGEAQRAAGTDALMTGLGGLEFVPGLGLIDLGVSAARAGTRQGVRALGAQVPDFLQPPVRANAPGPLTQEARQLRDLTLGGGGAGAIGGYAAVDAAGVEGDLEPWAEAQGAISGAILGREALRRIALPRATLEGIDPLRSVEMGGPLQFEGAPRVGGEIIDTEFREVTPRRWEAAVRDPETGRVYTGLDHQEAIESAADEATRARLQAIYDQPVEDASAIGMMVDGRFMSRDEGLASMREATGRRPVRMGEQVNRDGSVTERDPIDWDADISTSRSSMRDLGILANQGGGPWRPDLGANDRGLINRLRATRDPSITNPTPSETLDDLIEGPFGVRRAPDWSPDDWALYQRPDGMYEPPANPLTGEAETLSDYDRALLAQQYPRQRPVGRIDNTNLPPGDDGVFANLGPDAARGGAGQYGAEAFWDERLSPQQNKAVEMLRNRFPRSVIAEELDISLNHLSQIFRQARLRGVDLPAETAPWSGAGFGAQSGKMSTERMRELRAQGLTWRQIGDRAGMSAEAARGRVYYHDRPRGAVEGGDELFSQRAPDGGAQGAIRFDDGVDVPRGPSNLPPDDEGVFANAPGHRPFERNEAITDAQVAAIEQALAAGVAQRTLASEFGVSVGTIGRINRGEFRRPPAPRGSRFGVERNETVPEQTAPETATPEASGFGPGTPEQRAARGDRNARILQLVEEMQPVRNRRSGAANPNARLGIRLDNGYAAIAERMRQEGYEGVTAEVIKGIVKRQRDASAGNEARNARIIELARELGTANIRIGDPGVGGAGRRLENSAEAVAARLREEGYPDVTRNMVIGVLNRERNRPDAAAAAVRSDEAAAARLGMSVERYRQISARSRDPLAGVALATAGLGGAIGLSLMDEAEAQVADGAIVEENGLSIDTGAELPSLHGASGPPMPVGSEGLYVQEYADGRRFAFRMDRSGERATPEYVGEIVGSPSAPDQSGRIRAMEGVQPSIGEDSDPFDGDYEPGYEAQESAINPALRIGGAALAGLATRGLFRRGGARGLGPDVAGGASAFGADIALGGDPLREAAPVAALTPLAARAADVPIEGAIRMADNARLGRDGDFLAQREAFSANLPDEQIMLRQMEPRGASVIDRRFLAPEDEIIEQGFMVERPGAPSQRAQFLSEDPFGQQQWMQSQAETNQRLGRIGESVDRGEIRFARGAESRDPLALPPQSPSFTVQTGGRETSVFGEPKKPRQPTIRAPLEERAAERGVQGALEGVGVRALREIARDHGIEAAGRSAPELRRALIRQLARLYDSRAELVATLQRYGVASVPIAGAIGYEAMEGDQLGSIAP